MDGNVETEIARISDRIRRWRAEEGLTLQELARRSDLATSTVQKVETGQMTPSVAVLLKVARGLGRRPSELMQDGGPELSRVHQRKGDHPRTGNSKARYERLSADLANPSLEMWRLTLAPGASSGGEIRYDGEEVVLCERGRVTFVIGEERFALEAGDSLHFKASLPHSWLNEGRSTATFTVTGTLPGRLRTLIGGNGKRGARG